MNFNFANYKPKLTISAIGIIWAGSSFLLSKIWGYGFLQGIGPTVIVTALFTAYDKWAWKLPVFSLLNTVPDIRGEYVGKVKFYFNGQESTKDCLMRIKQSCSHVKVECDFSKEGDPATKSVSDEALITTDQLGDHKLIFLYQNEGSNLSGDSLDGHQGTNVLTISDEDEGVRLQGFYYTNRNPQTKGKIEVLKKKTK